MMKALAIEEYGGPEKLKIIDFPKPKIVKGTEIIIKVKASGVHIGDCIVRSGKISLLLWLKLPKIFGLDYSGIIEEVGNDVKDFKVGQEVYGELASFTGQTGTNAEYILADIKKDMILQKPDNLTFEEAAGLGVGALTANSGIEDAKIKPGDRVLVIGAGGCVGGYAVQFAKAKGAHVTAICSTKNIDMVKNYLGADEVLDYTKESFDNDLKSCEKFNAAYDSIGGDNYYNAVKPLLIDQKIYVTAVGSEYQGGGYDKVFIWYAIKMVATMIWRGKKYVQITDTKLKEFPKINQLVIDGKIKPAKTISLPLSEGQVAHSALDSRHPVGKYVLIP